MLKHAVSRQLRGRCGTPITGQRRGARRLAATRPLLESFTPFLSQLGTTLGVPVIEEPSSTLIPPGGPPRFRCVWPQCSPTDKLHEEKPVLIYLPGIDGMGAACEKQHESIFKQFSFVSLAIPADDRTPFAELVDLCVTFCHELAAMLPPDRPIYLMGESFGGVLAIAVAAKSKDAIDRLVLVNPATSYEDTLWPQMAAHKALEATGLADKILLFRQGLLDLIPMAGILKDILPQETLLWKLELLAQGNQYIRPLYNQVLQRTLILVAEQDRMLPSKDEGERLQKSLMRARVHNFPDRSHAILLEAGVDLVRVFREEGFLVQRRVMSGASGMRLPKRGNNFGRSGPVELPTLHELDLGISSSNWLRRLVSPVFFSTSADGEVIRGLGHLPVQFGTPVLLVGNHQTIPTDMPFIIEQIFREKGALVRGLTHPLAFVNDMSSVTGDTRNPDLESSVDRLSRRRAPVLNTFGTFLSTWGAVPVGGKALHDLLQDNECVMLFPGGAPEALKGTRVVERYRLLWSSRPEFVRAAAKFGATIVPFGAVGAEDQVESIMQPATMAKIGQLFPQDVEKQRRRQEAASKLQARKGVSRELGLSDSVESRLYVPVRVERYYYVFGRPVETSPSMYRDKDAIAAVYEQVQSGVNACIRYGLDKREQDPYRALLPRLIQEQRSKQQAPTFEP